MNIAVNRHALRINDWTMHDSRNVHSLLPNMAMVIMIMMPVVMVIDMAFMVPDNWAMSIINMVVMFVIMLMNMFMFVLVLMNMLAMTMAITSVVVIVVCHCGQRQGEEYG